MRSFLLFQGRILSARTHRYETNCRERRPRRSIVLFCGKAYFLRNVRKASLCLLYCFVRGTLSPSFTPCKGDNISQQEPVPSVSYADISPHCGESPLTPEMPPSAVCIIFLVNAVAVPEFTVCSSANRNTSYSNSALTAEGTGEQGQRPFFLLTAEHTVDVISVHILGIIHHITVRTAFCIGEYHLVS